jgi:hypothetical protein
MATLPANPLSPTLTLSSVLKTFTKAQTQLQALIDQNTAKAEQKMEQVRTLTSSVSELESEKAKAQKVLTNINQMLGEEAV